MVPDMEKGGRYYYFITLEHIPKVYSRMNLKILTMDKVLNIKDRHFLLFLKKMFGDFDKMHYSNAKIAQLLNTDLKIVDSMRETVRRIQQAN